MSLSRGTNINQNELRWNAQADIILQDFGGAPTNPLDEQIHWVVTIDDTGGPAGETKIIVYKDGEEVRRIGIITDECRGLGKRKSDQHPILHYYDVEKKGYRYATNWEIL